MRYMIDIFPEAGERPSAIDGATGMHDVPGAIIRFAGDSRANLYVQGSAAGAQYLRALAEVAIEAAERINQSVREAGRRRQ